MRIYLKHSCKKELNLKTSILVNACLSLKRLVNWVELIKDNKMSKLGMSKAFKYLIAKQQHPHLHLLLLPLINHLLMKFCKIMINNLYNNTSNNVQHRMVNILKKAFHESCRLDPKTRASTLQLILMMKTMNKLKERIRRRTLFQMVMERS